MKARNPQTGNLETVYVKALDGNPIGTILPYSKSTAPTGYMICDGSAISRTTYAELFSIIGTTFGSGDGSTTFNIPNLKGRVPVGYDSTQTEFDTLGETGGEKTHTLTTNEIPSHSHSIGIYTPNGSTGNWAIQYNTNAGVKLTTDASGGGKAHNILQPYLVLNYIIKVSQTRPLSATVVNEYNDSEVNAYSTKYINGINNYSTEEIFTGKYWIDGKPIYRKVFSDNSLPSGTAIGNIGNYQNVISTDGYVTAIIAGSSYKHNIGSDLGQAFYSGVQYRPNGDINILGSGSYNGQPYVLIVEYTKTTD